jgi:hypothetical protein
MYIPYVLVIVLCNDIYKELCDISPSHYKKINFFLFKNKNK